MKTPWSRQDTQFWISQLENRIEDIDYYLRRTVDWCETNNVYDDRIVFACSVMTVIWVSHMRGEPISKRETLEIIGVVDPDDVADEEYQLNEEFYEYDHEELLEEVVSRFY